MMTPKEFTDAFFEWAMAQDTGDLHVLLAASAEIDDGISVSTVIGTPDHDSRCLDEALIRLTVRMDAQRTITGQTSRTVRKDKETGEVTSDKGPHYGSQSN